LASPVAGNPSNVFARREVPLFPDVIAADAMLMNSSSSSRGKLPGPLPEEREARLEG
jgi:hypothetical protein